MKIFHYWSAIVQFLGMSISYMLGVKWLFYWCAFWTIYEVIFYLSIKEEK